MIFKINKTLYISLCSVVAIAIISTVAKSQNLLENSNVNYISSPPKIISDKINIQLSKEDIIQKNLEEYVIGVEVVEENNHITEINLTVESNITDDKIETLKIKMEEVYECYRFLNNESVIKINIVDNESIQKSFDIGKETSPTTFQKSDNIIISMTK